VIGADHQESELELERVLLRLSAHAATSLMESHGVACFAVMLRFDVADQKWEPCMKPDERILGAPSTNECP
jgi:hypothetical protein